MRFATACEDARGSLCGRRRIGEETASLHDELDADTASLCRSAQARLRYSAVDRPDIQHAVRVHSKSLTGPGVNDWHTLQRVARYVKRCPDTGILFSWH